MPRAIRAYLLSPLLLLAASAHAQHSGIGIKGGPLMSTYRAFHIKTAPIPGVTLGVYLPLAAAPRLEVQPELLLTMLGTALTEPDGDRSTLRTAYVELPLSAKFYFNNTVNLHGGLQLGKLITAHRTDPNGTTDVREGYNSFDMGFIMGAGLDLGNGLDLTMRYYTGMPTLLKNDDSLFPRNRSLQLTIGKRLVQMRRMYSAGTRRRK